MKNSVGQTALHSAVIRKNIDIAKELLATSATFDREDRFGRTPLTVACLQRWAPADLETVFGVDAPLCPDSTASLRQDLPKTPTGPSGGWLWDETSPFESGPCDIDVRVNLTADEFLIEYLSVQRPVRIRNALWGPEWDALRARWSREQLVAHYGHERVKRVEIPYAEAFGMSANLTTVADYLDYMRDLHEAEMRGTLLAQPCIVYFKLCNRE